MNPMSALASSVSHRRSLLALAALALVCRILVPGHFASAQSVLSADPWWQHAVVYEIYPRSFQASDGDDWSVIDPYIFWTRCSPSS